MRSMFRSALVALGAMLALGALASASASAALPEFTTTTSFVGSSERVTMTAGGFGEWDYKSSALKGTIATKTTVEKMEVNFAEASSPRACYNASKLSLLWTGVEGRLGYISKANKEVGLMLGEPVTTPIAKCTVFETDLENISGDIIAKITPVNTKTKHFVLHFLVNSKGEQEFGKFEGELQDIPLIFGKYNCEALSKTKKACGEIEEYAKLTFNVAEVEIETQVETEIQA
jgi:hypothetical protein